MTDQSDPAAVDAVTAAGEARDARPGALSGVRGGAIWVSLALLVLSVLALLAGPATFRLGLLPLAAARSLAMQAGLWLASAALAVGALALLLALAKSPRKGAIIAVALITGASLTALRVWGRTQSVAALPQVHEVQTDWLRPVAFSDAAMKERAAAGAAPPAAPQVGSDDSAARAAAVAQAQAYEFLKPHLFGATREQTLKAAIQSAGREGWTLTRMTSEGFEATATTRWYGLVSDIAVRIASQGDGARVDARALSRNGAPDEGANAQSLRAFMDDLELALRGSGSPLDTSDPSALNPTLLPKSPTEQTAKPPPTAPAPVAAPPPRH